jgi:hypothetical protein
VIYVGLFFVVLLKGSDYESLPSVVKRGGHIDIQFSDVLSLIGCKFIQWLLDARLLPKQLSCSGAVMSIAERHYTE